jgi:hypothetical protein
MIPDNWCSFRRIKFLLRLIAKRALLLEIDSARLAKLAAEY